MAQGKWPVLSNLFAKGLLWYLDANM